MTGETGTAKWRGREKERAERISDDEVRSSRGGSLC